MNSRTTNFFMLRIGARKMPSSRFDNVRLICVREHEARSLMLLKGEKMRLILLAAILTLAVPGLVLGQNSAKVDALEQEIKKLDAAEAEALLNKDVAALERLWAEDFTVNNPRNTISKGRKEVIALIRNGLIDYSSFVREVETLSFHGDTVISMGLETVKAVGKAPLAGQTVRRRFTHFWMKKDGKWILTARHANIICQN